MFSPTLTDARKKRANRNSHLVTVRNARALSDDRSLPPPIVENTRLSLPSTSHREPFRARIIPNHLAVFRPMSRLAAYRLRPVYILSA